MMFVAVEDQRQNYFCQYYAAQDEIEPAPDHSESSWIFQISFPISLKKNLLTTGFDKGIEIRCYIKILAPME